MAIWDEALGAKEPSGPKGTIVLNRGAYMDADMLQDHLRAQQLAWAKVIIVYDIDGYDLSVAMKNLKHDLVCPQWDTAVDPGELLIVNGLEKLSLKERTEFIRKHLENDVRRATVVIAWPGPVGIIEGCDNIGFLETLL